MKVHRLPWLVPYFLITCAACMGRPPCDDPIYMEVKETSQFGYDIAYWPADPSCDIYTSDANARAVADHFDPAGGFGLHGDYLNLSFREVSARRRDVLLENAWLTGGRSNTLFPGRIQLDTDELNSVGHATVDVKGLCAHELHHLVQYEYIPWGLKFLSYYPVGIEGPAVAMEDAVNLVLDDPRNFTNPWGYGYGAFHGNVHEYLKTVHDEHIWNGDGYTSGLFWKYLMEQFGAPDADPGWGVDFLQRVYTLADANGDGLRTTLQDVLDERDRRTTATTDYGVSLEEAFQDFSIANWTRRYANAEPYTSAYSIAVPDPERFLYLDENSSQPTSLLWVSDSSSSPQWRTPVNAEENYPKPEASHGPLAPGSNTGMQSASVVEYGSEYYVCSFDPPTMDGQAIGFWAQSDDSAKVWYALIGLRQSGVVDLIEKGSVCPNAANSFAHSVIQSIADPYKELMAVVIGEDGGSRDGFTFLTAGFTYYFSYFEPTIEVKRPNVDFKAYVGEGTESERFQVRVSVSSPDYLGSGSISGLTPELFTVAVGTPASSVANQGEVLSAAYVLGEYWLTVKAPEKVPSPSASQDLTVSIGSVSDTRVGSVRYADLAVDQMVVIDRSYSMVETVDGVRRVDAARAAAQLFVDASGSDDQIGIVLFSGDNHEPDSPDPYGDAEVAYHLSVMGSQWTRDWVNLILDETNPWGDVVEPSLPGYTSMGDGLFWGTKEIVDYGAADEEKWIIFLSDGHQNEDSDYEAQKAFLIGAGVKVETICLGPGVDRNRLQRIARQTGGRNYDVIADESTTAATASRAGDSVAGPGQDMLLDLADRYLLSSENIHRRERIVEEWGTLEGSATAQVNLSLEEGGLRDCVVTLYAGASSADVSLAIRAPDGSTLPAPDPGYTADHPDGSGYYWDPGNYVNYRIPIMENGAWLFDLSNNSEDSIDYLFVVSGKNRTGVQVQLLFAQYHGDATAYAADGLFLRGLPMPIVAVITDEGGPVLGAHVKALVEHPAFGAAALSLSDDGGSHDGAAGDGIYAATFTATTEYAASGGYYPEESPPDITPSYMVTLDSSGRDNRGRLFKRVNRGFFQVYDSQLLGPMDADLDALPARYEDQFDFLDPAVDNSAGDYDGDGLGHLEEYLRGTHPGMIDTDGGGETDKSEADNGANPLNRSDDALKRSRVARVLSTMNDVQPPLSEAVYRIKPGQNLLSYAVERGYSQVMIFRAPSETGPYSCLGTFPAEGAYIDSGLTNGAQYWYHVQPTTVDGRIGAPSAVFCGVPAADNVPPSGSLRINGGASYTTSTAVDLSFTVSPDAAELKYALDPDLSATPWGAVTSSVSGYALGTLKSGLPLTIFCSLRDAEGNVTCFDASITYLAPSDAGSVIGAVVASLDTDNRGIQVSLGGGNDFLTGPPGDFVLVAPTGVYDLTVNGRGYEAAVMPALSVSAGATVNVGTISLVPLDTDGDTLYDVAELVDYGTSRYLEDTDNDGLADGVEINRTLTDPRDAESVLAILDAGPMGAGLVQITWASVEGVSYDILYTEDVGSGEWARLDSVTGTYGQRWTSYTASTPLSATTWFYRVAVP